MIIHAAIYLLLNQKNNCEQNKIARLKALVLKLIKGWIMTFTANFTVRIDGAKSKTIDGLDNVIKQVNQLNNK